MRFVSSFLTTLTFLSSTLLIGGCAPVPQEPVDETNGAGTVSFEAGAGNEVLELLNYSSLESCSADAPHADMLEQLQISVALHDSIHELVACGGMTISICIAIVSGAVNTVMGQLYPGRPGGVLFEEGRYVTSTGNTDAGEVSVMFHTQTEDGLEPIEVNLFEASAYLIGASATGGISEEGYWAEVRFTEPGPYVQLLGLGPNPTSPIRLSEADIGSLSPDLSGLYVSSTVVVHDEQGDSVVDYEVESPPVPLGSIFADGFLDYELLNISATNSKTGQVATARELDWGIGFGDDALTGSAAFDMTGGIFDYGLYYGHSADHSDDIIYSCPADEFEIPLNEHGEDSHNHDH